MLNSDPIQANGAERSPVFVEPAWLAEHLNDPAVRVVEVDVRRPPYDQGHIPGAVLWNAYTDLHHPDYGPLGRSELAALLDRSGITPGSTIVFYGYGPALGFWLVKAYGHERALLLRGTRDTWRDAGLPWTTDPTQPAPTTYTVPTIAAMPLMSLNALRTTLDSSDSLILDVRSDAEFAGERFWPSGATEGAGRPGHMPGAVHLNADLLRTPDGAYKSATELRQLLQDRGALPGRTLVTYCTIGIRASEVAMVLTYLLGYPKVRVYDGSWAEWGTHVDTPIEI